MPDTPTRAAVRVTVDDLAGAAIRDLLAGHHTEMAANSPACSMHALDLTALRDPAITVWSAWLGDDLAGCGALKELDAGHGEVKSMRTAEGFTGRGVAATVLAAIVAEARARGYTRLSLETGAEDFFAPARRLYLRHGFVECGPFADYVLDPYSRFFTRELDPA
ncbi:GNAT family N-acetyltransferase [Nocardia neocaledoniensis]|uniref:GNAT family N-acetyltransferase n=1 Tax=Nocardia neocaledoniensis TaxID=236511 RepID=UPI002458B1F0|nr:GNAT family N-acetyltransferase [Nocardia neocaledoniensis]